MLFVWDYEFQHPPEKVWPLVADTDRLYRAAGLPPVEFSHEPDRRGGTVRFGRFRLFGLGLAWQEQPYEWIRNRFFQVDRNFESGPLDFVRIQWRFFVSETGCRLQTTLQVKTSNALWQSPVALVVKYVLRRRFFRVYRRLARFLDGNIAQPYSCDKDEGAVIGNKYRDRLAIRFASEGVAEELAERLAEYVLTGPLREVSRMRPNLLARRWELPVEEVFRALLKLTDKVFLRLAFELTCSSCRQVLSRSRHLKDIAAEAFCEQCQRSSTPHAGETLQMSFAPIRSLRRGKDQSYCRGGPVFTPHYETQLLLYPEADRAIELLLPAGDYCLRSLHSTRKFAIHVSDRSGTVERPVCSFPRPDQVEQPPPVPEFGSGRVGIFLRNEMHLEIQAMLENCAHERDEFPLLQAFTRQDFTDIFPQEAPPADRELPAGRLTFLCAEISAGPDAPARLADLVEVTRAHQGMVFQSNASELAAMFAQPAAAMQAALAFHQTSPAPAPGSPDDLRLKTALHHGPAVAVNTDDRLNFSGTTVSVVRGLCAHGEGGDIVFTAPVLKDPGVRAVLHEAGIARFSRSDIQTPEYERPLPLFRHVCRRVARVARA